MRTAEELWEDCWDATLGAAVDLFRPVSEETIDDVKDKASEVRSWFSPSDRWGTK